MCVQGVDMANPTAGSESRDPGSEYHYTPARAGIQEAPSHLREPLSFLIVDRIPNPGSRSLVLEGHRLDSLDLGERFLQHPLHAGLQGHHGVHAADTRACQANLHDAVRDVEKLDVASVALDVGSDVVQHLLHPFPETALLRLDLLRHRCAPRPVSFASAPSPRRTAPPGLRRGAS